MNGAGGQRVIQKRGGSKPSNSEFTLVARLWLCRPPPSAPASLGVLYRSTSSGLLLLVALAYPEKLQYSSRGEQPLYSLKLYCKEAQVALIFRVHRVLKLCPADRLLKMAQ
ncbi:hypothetical protein MHYP_G00143400 [Metynnis hypsauchen]